jgi:hypothetical protein
MRRATASSRVSKYQFKKPRARLNSALNSRRPPYFELQCCSLAGTRASREFGHDPWARADGTDTNGDEKRVGSWGRLICILTRDVYVEWRADLRC